MALFQTFRYGRHKLSYEFPIPDGEYLVELYFIEPWFGIGGSMDCKGWRIFDVAINDSIVLKNLDIWKEAGGDHILKKIVKATVKGGRLIISFPKVSSNQAIISAIAIATSNPNIIPAPAPKRMIKDLITTRKADSAKWTVQSWLDTGNQQYADKECTFSALPQELYGDEWIRTANITTILPDTSSIANFTLNDSAEVYVALDTRISKKPEWLNQWTSTKLFIENDNKGGTRFNLYKKHFPAEANVRLFGVGGNSNVNMYSIIIHKPSILEQPTLPVRSSVTYEAEEANLKGPKFESILDGFGGKGYATFTNSAPDTIDWSVNVGVGDTYVLRFKYLNSTSKDIVGFISVISDDGTILSAGTVYFSPSSKKIWDKVITTTANSINAGHYRIRLITSEAAGLFIDNLKVQ